MSVQNYTNQYCSYIHEWDAVYEEYAKSVGLSYTGLIVLYEIYELKTARKRNWVSIVLFQSRLLMRW